MPLHDHVATSGGARPLVHVFQDPNCPVELFAPNHPHGTNLPPFTAQTAGPKDIEVPYATSAFNFLESDTHKQLALLREFVAQIGPTNAAKLAHVCINFPFVLVAVEREASSQQIDILVSKCPDIEILELYIHDKEYESLLPRTGVDMEDIKEHIVEFDHRLRRLSKLEKVIIRFFTGSPTRDIQWLFESVGWEIREKYGPL